jgi:hypothetical protein
MVGLILGLHLIAKEKQNRKSCAIGSDSQVVIKALQTELTNLGHHLAAEVLWIATHLRTRNGNANYSLTIRWTAGHVGIEGNEKADWEAKCAVEGLSSDINDLPKYVWKKIKNCILALWQENNKETNDIWTKEWQASIRHRHFMCHCQYGRDTRWFTCYCSS